MSVQIYNDIKGIIQDVVGASQPTDLIIGEVVKEDPVEFKVSNLMENLPDILVEIPKSFSEIKRTIKFNGRESTLYYDNRLKIGEKVYMLKANKGQRFLVLSRVELPSQPTERILEINVPGL